LQKGKYEHEESNHEDKYTHATPKIPEMNRVTFHAVRLPITSHIIPQKAALDVSAIHHGDKETNIYTNDQATVEGKGRHADIA